MRILLADDESTSAKTIRLFLEKNKFSVDFPAKENDISDSTITDNYDILILSMSIPQINSLQIVRKLRNQNVTVPILLLDTRNDPSNLVAGLDAGADDYLPKPFDPEVFLAKIKALARRSECYFATEVSLGNVILDTKTYTIFSENKSELLNNKEFQIMSLFMAHPGCIYSTEFLMDHIWGHDSTSDIDVVWTYIGFIRKKLKIIGADIRIQNLRGCGYLLEEAKTTPA